MTRYVKLNYMNDVKNMKDLWQCDSCQTKIDSMKHVLWCPSYHALRKDRNLDDDQDLAKYLHEVMMIRSKLNLQKLDPKMTRGCHCPAQARPRA